MKGQSPVAGLIVLSSVLFVLAGVFCALFLLNRPDPNSDKCLAAARMFAGVASNTAGVSEEAGDVAGAVFVRACGSDRSS